MVEVTAELIEIIQRTPSVKSFRFKPDKQIGFKPGQFFRLTTKVGAVDKAKYFSFSSSPTERGYVEFTKRLTASPFSSALNQLRNGDQVKLSMPMGKFTFEGEYEKIAMLSGGVGITPLRSICKYATDKKLETDIVLIYGNSKEEEIIFRQDFDAMQSANKNFRVVHTLTSPDIDKNARPRRTGHIDPGMIKEEIPDYKERIFYVCGPPKMVGSLLKLLREELRIDNNGIKFENFAGY